ncbi:MAG: 2-succinyl-5-enolpyruvyl-6-hydroxy-3-cyclohexene-1-carboxylic-acid synthase [Bacteroidetes bacterium]|nr:MAG: 2-succinyl-5-enolpyruvyl-6-hydroxy-3-cyclohexene-1-carboxylic-acid synthase [Bacteroidota bacterium]
MSTRAWPELMVEELFRCGLDTYFIAPGSRSTPLVSAIARHSQAKKIVHFDERGTAFAAIGYARFTGRPAAWVTTSGTAVANGLPAVVESSIDNIPLLLLTADRPPELRDTGANQTILQSGIFGSYVRWFFDISVQDQKTDPAFVLTTMDHAIHRCLSEPGPVHINCMYRKPLELGGINSGVTDGDPIPGLKNWSEGSRPYTHYDHAALRCTDIDAASRTIDTALHASHRPVFLLGGGMRKDVEILIADWAAQRQIPVFPDIGSSLRLNPGSTSVIPHWVVAGDGRYTDTELPDLIIQFGPRIVSTKWDKAVAADSDIIKIVVAPGNQRIDPDHNVSARITVDSEGTAALIRNLHVPEPRKNTWLNSWIESSKTVSEELRAIAFGKSSNLSEEIVAYLLPDLLPADSVLMIGNSLSVRHVDQWGGSSTKQVMSVISRGTSGIDGTIAQAVGLHVASGKPTAVLLGDQSLLHDLNSLAMVNGRQILVVVVNNDGGRIFHQLPISEQRDVFEPLFVNSQGINFEHAAAQFGINYVAARTLEEFRQAMERFLMLPESLMIEVPIDYDRNESLRSLLDNRIAVALSSSSGE